MAQSMIPPDLQAVKGVFVFNPIDELTDRAQALLKSLNCEVIAVHGNRFTIKTKRGNIQTIKRDWLGKNRHNTVSKELALCVAQITIGGPFR